MNVGRLKTGRYIDASLVVIYIIYILLYISRCFFSFHIYYIYIYFYIVSTIPYDRGAIKSRPLYIFYARVFDMTKELRLDGEGIQVGR